MSTTTTNYELIKPSGSERPDVDIINNNMDTLDEELVVGTTNDIETSSVTVSTGWTDANPLTLGEKFQSAMTKISTMIKNLKWIYKFIGSTDISSIGDGTVTSAISSLNTAFGKTQATMTATSLQPSSMNGTYVQRFDPTTPDNPGNYYGIALMFGWSYSTNVWLNTVLFTTTGLILYSHKTNAGAWTTWQKVTYTAL